MLRTEQEFEEAIKGWIARKRIVIVEDVGYTTNEVYEEGKLAILEELEKDFRVK